MKEVGGIDFEKRKEEIEQLGLNAISEYFKVDPTKLSKAILVHLHNKAKIAMQFDRELGVTKRAIELNYIRVFKLIADDKKELKKYIQVAMPKYNPLKKA